MTSSAEAQSGPRYRIIDLGALGVPGSQGYGGGYGALWSVARGVSEDGVVVGWSEAQAFDKERHAFVWVPDDRFAPAIAARTMTDLTDLAAFTATGAAHGVNTHGQVVGEQQLGDGPVRAFEWNVGDYPASGWARQLGVFGLTGDQTSVAWAINDRQPAIAVGEATAPTGCGFGEKATTAFKCELATTVTLIELDPLVFPGEGSDEFSAAYAVANPNDETDPSEVGGESYVCPAATPCQGPRDSVGWKFSGPSGFAAWYVNEFGMQPSALEGVVRGMNDGLAAGGGATGTIWAELVGQARVDDEPCARHAVYWADRLVSAPLDLHAVYAPTDPAGESEARDIRNRVSGSVEVVGVDLESGLAVRWQQDAPTGAWSASLVQDEISALCGWGKLNEANAVNDDGWIVGFGQIGVVPPIERRAYLAVPVACFGDLDGSGVVDGADFGLVLAAWGACASGADCTYCVWASSCPADLDCNGVVDGIDLGLLLAQWECGGGSSSAMAGGGGGAESGSAAAEAISGVPIETALELAGFDDFEELAEWAATATVEQLDALGEWLTILAGGVS